MSVYKLRHTFDPQTATEYAVLVDSHKRELHLRVPVLSGKAPDGMLEKAIAEFEQQERDIHDHIAANFNPKTLEKLPVAVSAHSAQKD